MPFLGQRQQQFKLVEQPSIPSDSVVAYKLSRRACTNTQKPATDTSFIGISHRPIALPNRSEFAIAAWDSFIDFRMIPNSLRGRDAQFENEE
jgi:hypothetical protein